MNGRSAADGVVAAAPRLLYSAAVRSIFGCFPVRKAPQLDSIEALRHE